MKNQIRIKKLLENTAVVRQKLTSHALYTHLNDTIALRHFMEHHCFAVWDFMSLLKALQRDLTCTTLPWMPVGNPHSRYLINEIVAGEESDVDEQGNYSSHFELYLRAMAQVGADLTAIDQFIRLLQNHVEINEALTSCGASEAAQKFVRQTFETIRTGKPHVIAAVFTFGREDLIPCMFIEMVNEIAGKFPNTIDILKYYLERHIEVDGGHHSQLAYQMTSELCGDDELKWKEAGEAAILALESRLALWDNILATVSKN
jgi:hypothetical protein